MSGYPDRIEDDIDVSPDLALATATLDLGPLLRYAIHGSVDVLSWRIPGPIGARLVPALRQLVDAGPDVVLDRAVVVAVVLASVAEDDRSAVGAVRVESRESFLEFARIGTDASNVCARWWLAFRDVVRDVAGSPPD